MFNKPEPDQVSNLSMTKKSASLKIDTDRITGDQKFFDDLDDAAFKRYSTARLPKTP
jgi:hypothetical protein